VSPDFNRRPDDLLSTVDHPEQAVDRLLPLYQQATDAAAGLR